MSKKLSSNEIQLIGNWVEENGLIVQDSVYQKIHWLTDYYLEQIAVDSDNWSILYKNPDDDSYWELTYPKSHMHGGGAPALHRLSKNEANKRYGKFLS